MRTVAALCRELLPDRRTDGALLASFVSERDEVTFLELVRRHGPLVWGVCRRTLPDPADAEDAFQATFLVLVSQAGKLAARDTLGPWLHRVAVWTARNVRRKNARRLARQREMPEAPASAPDADLKADIDGALLSLPARYREPIILCHLQGFTRREAAERLGCAEGTLSAWLNRGLAKLRVRLRSLDPAPALAVAAVAVPAVLTANTARAAVASGVASTVPPAVSSLVEGVLHMLWIKKATAAAFALCAVFVVGVGVGLGTRPAQTGAAAQEGPVATNQPTTKPAAPANNDKLVAELTEQIQVAEEQLRLRRDLVKLASAKLDIWKQLNPKAKPSPAELEPLLKAEAELEAGAAELQLLKAKLAKFKGAKPAPPVADESLLRKMDDLKRQMDQVEAERKAATADAKAAEQRLAAVHARFAELQRAAELLAAQAQSGNKAAPDGWHIEITVRAKGGEFVVSERRSDPRLSDQPGSVRTDDPWALTLLLQHAKADPKGPQEVRVFAEGDAPAAQLRAALEACKSAGFKTVTAKTIDPPAAKPGPNAGTRLEDLRKLEEIERKKLEDELQELRKQREAELLELKKRDLEAKPKRESPQKP